MGVARVGSNPAAVATLCHTLSKCLAAPSCAVWSTATYGSKQALSQTLPDEQKSSSLYVMNNSQARRPLSGGAWRQRYPLATSHVTVSVPGIIRRFARVVKGLDLKSNGRCPRRFEPCSRRCLIFATRQCLTTPSCVVWCIATCGSKQALSQTLPDDQK